MRSEDLRVPVAVAGALLVIACAKALVAPAPAAAQVIWVANAGEDTVSKVDVVTMCEVARYRTWFGPAGQPGHVAHLNNAWAGAAPSRIAVDRQGNAYVLNRHFDGRSALLLKILATGPGPTSTDADASCSIDPGEILPLADNNPANGQVDATEIQDKRVAWAVPVGMPGGLGRALCLGPDGNLWVGLFNSMEYYQVRAGDGAILGGPISTQPHTAYGCVVAPDGNLWSASSSNTMAQIDTNTKTLVAVHSHPNQKRNYGISLLGGCKWDGNVYLASWDSPLTSANPALSFLAYDTDNTTTVGQFSSSASIQFSALGIGVGLDGNIVVGNGTPSGGVTKFSPSGAVIWTSPAQAGTSEVRGIIIDANDDVWAVHRADHNLSKYDGATGAHLGVVPIGDSPYSYGNATPPECPCAKIETGPIECLSQVAGTGTYSFGFTLTNANPFGTAAAGFSLTSTSATILAPTSPVTFPSLPPGGTHQVQGQFTVAGGLPGDTVCLDIKLFGGHDPQFEEPEWCCPAQSVCFTLPRCPEPCFKAVAQIKCRPDGSFYLELTIINNGPAASASVQVSSTTPGVTVLPAVQPLVLPSGGTATITFGLAGASLGQMISLLVDLHGPQNLTTGAYEWCCAQRVEARVPRLPCSIISGEVFEDINANARRDPGEPGLGGWKVSVVGEAGERTTVSDATGRFAFAEHPPGVYRVTVVPARGWVATGPPTRSLNVTQEEGAAEGTDFGFTRFQPR